MVVCGVLRPSRKVGHRVPRREWARWKLVGAASRWGQRSGGCFHGFRPLWQVWSPVQVARRQVGRPAAASGTRPLITGKGEHLYSLTCPLMLATILVAIPKYTKGKLPATGKEKGRVSPSLRRLTLSTTRATTRPTCCPRRALWTKPALPPRRVMARSAGSRNGRRLSTDYPRPRRQSFGEGG